MTSKQMKRLKDLMIRARANAFDTIESAEGLLEITATCYRRIERINDALDRMDDGNYGTCLDCGTEIAQSRLLMQPWVETCVACRSASEVFAAKHRPAEAA